MTSCGQKAVLVVTTTPAGTATNIARERIELACTLAAGHQGMHRDDAHAEEWDAAQGQLKMLLRDESEV